jgi:hypothetical protein
MIKVFHKIADKLVHSHRYAATVSLIFAFLSFFDFPVGWVSTVIIGLITLQKGPKEGLSIMMWAMLPAFAMLYLGYSLVFVNVVILHYLVVWFFAWLLLRKNRWSLLIQVGSLLGIFAVITVHIYNPNVSVWWAEQLEAFLKEFEDIYPIKSLSLNPQMTKIWFDYFVLMATGVLAILIIFSNFVYLFFARAWQGLIKQTIRLRGEFYQIRMNSTFTSIMMLIILAGLIDYKIFMDMLPIVLFPFVISGLSLSHALLARMKKGQLFLFLFYCLLIGLSPYMLILLSMFGFVDGFINFRKRFTLTFI